MAADLEALLCQLWVALHRARQVHRQRSTAAQVQVQVQALACYSVPCRVRSVAAVSATVAALVVDCEESVPWVTSVV